MSKAFRILFSIFLFSFFYYKPVSAQDLKKTFTDSLIAVLPMQKEDSAKALVLFNIARMKMGEAQNSGNWDEPIRWAERFLTTSIKVKYKFGIRRSHWMIATCLKMKGIYPEAINHYMKGLQYAYNDNNNVGIIAFSQNLAETFLIIGNYQEALKYYLEGYKVLMETKDNRPVTEQQMSFNIAQAFAKMNNYPEALNWAQKALPENSASFYPGDLSLFIATVNIELKQYDQALENLSAALKLFPERFRRFPANKYKGIAGEWYVDYGEAWLKMAKLKNGSEKVAAYHEAVSQLQKSIPLLEEGSGGRQKLMDAYGLLKGAFTALDDYENALRYTNLYLGIRDSIFNQQTYLKLADQRMQFERQKASVEQAARLEKQRLDDEIIRRKMLSDQQLQNEQLVADEKFNYERKIADAKLLQQAVIAEEKLQHKEILARQRQEQVKLLLEKKRINNLLVLGSTSLIIVAFLLFLLFRQRSIRKRTIERAEALRRMAELELQSLRSQLNPHFMFNSLNSIQELILMDENEKSHSYLARFSKLLRMLLENAEKPFIPVQKELDFLQLYLGLENLRVPDLQYKISVDPELDTTRELIPNMILQPYIENAIWHGLSHKKQDRQLEVRIYRRSGTIHYEIEDNGVGRKKAAELKSLFRQKHNSKGIELLNKRFRLLNREYSSEIKTSIQDVMTGSEVTGTIVVVTIPSNIFEPMHANI